VISGLGNLLVGLRKIVRGRAESASKFFTTEDTKNHEGSRSSEGLLRLRAGMAS
jgi:hypothetical protein